MARAPKTDHAEAIRAFILKRITKEEFQLCCRGEAYVQGNWIMLPEGWGWIGKHIHPRYAD